MLIFGYQGKVISMEVMMSFSERLFGTIGDGVLFKVDKDAYIELCKQESRKPCLAMVYI